MSHTAELSVDMVQTPRSRRKRPQHIAFIDGLRAAAALIVLVDHMTAGWMFWGGQDSLLHQALSRYVTMPLHLRGDGGLLAVLIFFLVSGYIVTHASMRETRHSYGVKRFARLMPALWTALLVTVALFILRHWIGLGSQPGLPMASPGRMVQSLFMVDAVSGMPLLPVTWTLLVELAFYLCLVPVLYFQRHRPLQSTWILAGMATCLGVGSIVLPLPEGSLAVSVIHLPFLLIGRLIYLVHIRRTRLRRALPPGRGRQGVPAGRGPRRE